MSTKLNMLATYILAWRRIKGMIHYDNTKTWYYNHSEWKEDIEKRYQELVNNPNVEVKWIKHG